MMTKTEINKILASILLTLDEETQPAPESSLYLALNCSLDQWNDIKAILINCNLAIEEHNAMTITPAGSTMTEKIRQFYQPA